jgi:hypothetical protein
VDKATPPGVKARMQAMLELLTELDTFYGQLRRLSPPVLKRAVRMGDKLIRMI